MVSEDVLKESVLSVLADIDVLVEIQDIEVCHRFGKPDRESPRKQLCVLWTEKSSRKFYLSRKKISSIDNSKQFYAKYQKFLQMRIWHPWMSQLPTTAESWSTIVSFMVAFREMTLSESNFGTKIDLCRFSIWISFMGFFPTLILGM